MVDPLSKEPEVPLRMLSILVAIMIASVLAYAYHTNLPSLVYDMKVASLFVFVTIPMLAGFIAGIIHPEKAIINGLYAGLIIGVVNSIMAALKILFKQELLLQELCAFAFFAIVSIFLWMIITCLAALLGKQVYS